MERATSPFIMRRIKLTIRVNSDEELVKMIRDGLKAKDGYCPCMIEMNEDTKCMCKAFREMEEGMCHCGLYVKE